MMANKNFDETGYLDDYDYQLIPYKDTNEYDKKNS